MGVWEDGIGLPAARNNKNEALTNDQGEISRAWEGVKDLVSEEEYLAPPARPKYPGFENG